MKFKVIAENGAEKELEIGNSTLKELRLFLEENQQQEDVFDFKEDYFYYTIDDYGNVHKLHWFDCDYEKDRVKVANACKDKKLMEKRALNETLNRLMWRFSMQNGGREIDWKDKACKVFIYYDYHDKRFWCGYNDTSDNDLGIVYFKTEETAERCIEEVIKPFLAEHPDFEPNVY